MKPIERFQALLDGKKIRISSWIDQNAYVYLDRDSFSLQRKPISFFGFADDIFHPDLEWEVYEDPKEDCEILPEGK